MNSDPSALKRILEPLRRRVALMVRRAVIKLVKDCNPVQVMQLSGFCGECRQGVERIQEYGFNSVPPVGGQVIMASVDGECGHEVVIATDDRRYRPRNNCPGDVMLYTAANRAGDADTEHHLFMEMETRLLRIRAKNIVFDADENIELRAGREVNITAGGNVNVNGAEIRLNE